VNYPFCIARQKRYLKNVYKYNKLQNLDYLDIGENPEISLNLKSDFSFNHFQSHYLRPDEAFGRVLIFKNNKSIFLRENSTVFCYHNNNIIEKKCYELDKNDICMIVNNEKESVNQVLSTMLKQENVENLKQYCTVWKKALRDYLEVNSLFDLKQDLEEKGVKLCINTLKNWINKDNILGPKKYSHFIAIKEITNNLELINQYKEIWEAISFLRGKSIIAGKNNMKLILSNIRNKKIDIKLNEEKNINGIGNVNFYEFDFFYSKCSLKNCYLDKIMDLNDLIKILKEV